MERWTKESLNNLRRMGDPLADDTIEVVFREGEYGIDAVDQILGSLILTDQILSRKLPNLSDKAARALLTYLKEGAALPDWTDQKLIEEGELVYMQYGMMGFTILGCASLPESYATLYGAKVLGTTQQLEIHIQRRLYETTQFVIDVMSEGGLKPNGKGVLTTLKVRLMHAAIRKLILHNPPAGVAAVKPSHLGEAFKNMQWPLHAFGKPVHQVAMSMAILSFSYIVLRSLRKLGVELTEQQETAYLHCWNVVAHVMGVSPELLLSRPETMLEAEYLYNSVWPPAIIETEEGRQLEKALLNYMEGFIPSIMAPLRHIPRILTRHLLSDRISDVLGVKLDCGETIGLEALKGLAGLHEFGRGIIDALDVNFEFANRMSSEMLVQLTGLRHLHGESMGQLPATRIAAEWLFRVMANGLQNRQRGGDRHPFQIPAALAKRKWRLDR